MGLLLDDPLAGLLAQVQLDVRVGRAAVVLAQTARLQHDDCEIVEGGLKGELYCLPQKDRTW